MVARVIADENPRVRQTGKGGRTDIAKTPVPTVLSVPPVMDAPLMNWTCDPSGRYDAARIYEATASIAIEMQNATAAGAHRPKLVIRRLHRDRRRTQADVPLKTLASIRPPLRFTIASSFVPRLPELLVSP